MFKKTFSPPQGQFCDYCNSEDSRKAHPATHAIDGSERWWQSPPLSSGIQYNEVNLTLDLGQVSLAFEWNGILVCITVSVMVSDMENLLSKINFSFNPFIVFNP